MPKVYTILVLWERNWDAVYLETECFVFRVEEKQ